MLDKRLNVGIAALAVALGATISLSGLANAATPVGIAAGAARAPVLPVKTTPTMPVTTRPPATAPGPVVSLPTVPITGVFEPMPVPLFPGVSPLQTSQKAVVVNWYDRSTDEQSFVVYRRDAAGNWQNVYEVPTRDQTGQGDDYSWVDTDTNQSGQCYMIAAVSTWGSGVHRRGVHGPARPVAIPTVVPIFNSSMVRVERRQRRHRAASDGNPPVLHEPRMEQRDLRCQP